MIISFKITAFIGGSRLNGGIAGECDGKAGVRIIWMLKSITVNILNLVNANVAFAFFENSGSVSLFVKGIIHRDVLALEIVEN